MQYTNPKHVLLVALGLTVIGCSAPLDAPDVSNDRPQLAGPHNENRTPLTAEQCEDRGGFIVGDIGDGRIHSPDYLCENRKPPLGVILYTDQQTRPIEGAVCCGSNE